MIKHQGIREKPRNPTEWINESIDTLLENTRVKEIDDPNNISATPEEFPS